MSISAVYNPRYVERLCRTSSAAVFPYRSEAKAMRPRYPSSIGLVPR